MILPLLAKEEKAREGQLTLTAACIYSKGDNTKAAPSLLSLPPMTSQPRHFPAVYGDTTYTKVFVGGLAWETKRDTLGAYFEQFGDILEAVVITDKHTGRSKGYGFVTFNDPESAMRACIDPSPVIDGRRANCNLASLGATQRTYPPTPHLGLTQFRHASSTSTAIRGSSAATPAGYFHPAASQYAYPYGFLGYNHEGVYVQSYYGGGQQQQQQHFTPYYPAAAQQGLLASQFTPYYPYYGQTSQSHAQPPAGPALHYTQLQQYGHYTAHNYSGTGILSLPAPPSVNAAAAAAGTAVVINAPSSSQQPRATAPEFKPST